MQIYTLLQEQRLGCPLQEAFAFFSDPYNLDKITPGWLHFRIVDAPPKLYRGCLLHYRLRLHGVPLTWVSQIVEWDPPCRFIDVQVIGPYRLWHHVHEFEPIGDGMLVRDIVHYALPLSWLGRLAHQFLVRRDLERIFAYRRERILQLLSPFSRGQ